MQADILRGSRRSRDNVRIAASGGAVVFRHLGFWTSWRAVAAGIVLAAYACIGWPGQSLGHAGSKAHGGTHLYVFLGFGDMSPGLSEFGAKASARGIPTTVTSYAAWSSLAKEAIGQYKSGQLHSIMIVGHSLGGGAARAMAAALGRAGVPVKLLVTLDPVGEQRVSSNVRRSVNILPTGNETHFSVIVAHARELRRYVFGAAGGSGATPEPRMRQSAQ
jgi:pimeloyl-ACP methyl ester carboxylesterase